MKRKIDGWVIAGFVQMALYIGAALWLFDYRAMMLVIGMGILTVTTDCMRREAKEEEEQE